ncbi:hypothetical protein RF11_14110 [Thelohanellus kitauei]|uniref:Uncharacterized protein n=1 Tax=Thelohanellus kitauei TaxID=669202 RepID=A0A0C2MBG1_THEKT|nr:hypothetical protein RF11_14110 [Thelohanellus kitauei]
MKINIIYFNKSNPNNVWRETVNYHLFLINDRCNDSLRLSYANHQNVEINIFNLPLLVYNRTVDNVSNSNSVMFRRYQPGYLIQYSTEYVIFEKITLKLQFLKAAKMILHYQNDFP